jgi:alpha-glucosidase
VNASTEWGIAEYKDVESQKYWKEAVRLSKDGTDVTRKERIMHGLQLMARDHARLPLQWDPSSNGGFSQGKPWMRVHDDYKAINVETQEGDANSVLSFWKQLLRLRKEHKDVFIYGSFELLDAHNVSIFAYKKRFRGQAGLVVLNFTAERQALPEVGSMRLLLSSYPSPTQGTLQSYEGRIYMNY